MLRLSIGSLLLASTLALAGCADGTPAPSSDVAEAEEPFASGSLDPQLVGTFRGDTVALGELMLLVLKSDGTFHYGMVIVCATAPQPCGPIEEGGNYKLTQKDAMNFLELYSEKGIQRARYQYAFDGDALRMRRVDTGSGIWRTMTRSDSAWCGAPADCGVQNLAEGTCVGDWECLWNVCSYQCSEQACETAGGQCQTKGGCAQGGGSSARNHLCKEADLECCLAPQPELATQ